MGAPTGNRFWKNRSTYGREKIFDNSESLWMAACEYFEWVEDNPLYEDKVSFYQGVPTHDPIEKMRAMTISGLCLFLEIDHQTFDNYGSKPGYEDYFGIVEKIRQVIYTQKFTGAAADLLNSNIIARDLGLADKTDIQSTDGSMTPAQISDEDLKKELEKYGIKPTDS